MGGDITCNCTPLKLHIGFCPLAGANPTVAQIIPKPRGMVRTPPKEPGFYWYIRDQRQPGSFLSISANVVKVAIKPKAGVVAYIPGYSDKVGIHFLPPGWWSAEPIEMDIIPAGAA